jgi:putative lipoic acid-binding regulatory protein
LSQGSTSRGVRYKPPMPEHPSIDDLVDFPSVFTFRVVARASESLLGQVKEIVEKRLERPAMNVGLQSSSAATFASVRVTVTVLDADEIRDTYAALKEIPDLKMLL